MAAFTHALNTLQITRREDGANLSFPPNGVTYRGGALPNDHKKFYKVGALFRAAGFLATSFSQDNASEYMCRASVGGEPCVLWEVHVDPAGGQSQAMRCKHVCYLEHGGEKEYLFAPYSPFTVDSVSDWLYVRLTLVHSR